MPTLWTPNGFEPIPTTALLHSGGLPTTIQLSHRSELGSRKRSVRKMVLSDATIRMKPQPEPSSREVLAGLVERVTYHNDGNGYCVLRIKARGHRELVTVVGHAAVISAGEWITASGEWVNDRTHGQQYRAKFLKTSAPTSLDGI